MLLMQKACHHQVLRHVFVKFVGARKNIAGLQPTKSDRASPPAMREDKGGSPPPQDNVRSNGIAMDWRVF
jgi:hypothetical protein